MAYLSTHHIHDKEHTHTHAHDWGTGWGGGGQWGVGGVFLLLCHTKEKQGFLSSRRLQCDRGFKKTSPRVGGEAQEGGSICILIADSH